MTTAIRGRILHLQRLSTEDGPGIRTTVFFKGCPLRCVWCHNPESISPRVEIQWYAVRCLNCRTCLGVCPQQGLEMTADGLRIDRQHCRGCGTCAEACPSNAIELLGRDVTVEEVLEELLKDRVYYDTSGGGVTLSGGEPTMQPEFALEVLRSLRKANVHTALDTCGLCTSTMLERLLPFTDLVLYDLKLMNNEAHQHFTGQPNRRILENLLYLREWMSAHSPAPELWIRTPLIPNATAVDENVRLIGAFLASNLNGYVTRWELCAFNNLCRNKYTRLNREWQYAEQPLLAADELAHLEDVAKSSGVDVTIVQTSGATRLQEETWSR